MEIHSAANLPPLYLKTIPFDPQNGLDKNTYYTILRDSNDLMIVRAL